MRVDEIGITILTFPHQVLKMLPLHQKRKGGKGGLHVGTFIQKPRRFHLSTIFLAPPHANPPNEFQHGKLVSGGPFKFAPLEGAQSLPPPFLPFLLPFCASSALSLRRAATASPW